MKPTLSFWDNFSSEGRVKKLWTEAVGETDQAQRLALLRAILDKIGHPPAFFNLWVPFLDAFLSRDALGVARAITSGRKEEGFDLLLRQQSDRVLATWQVERILPQLCVYIREKKSTPPAFLTSILYRRDLSALDSAALVRLDWCASFLGNGERACYLWEEALLKDTTHERYKTWQQDFVSFLCR